MQEEMVRGEGLFFDDDAEFKITGLQIKLTNIYTRQQGGSRHEAEQIHKILKEVVLAARTTKSGVIIGS